MWGYVLAGAAGLTCFGWWVRRPHHHGSGGERSGDGPFPAGLTSDDDQGTPSEPGLPENYDGD
jgi:hypothetical protein